MTFEEQEKQYRESMRRTAEAMGSSFWSTDTAQRRVVQLFEELKVANKRIAELERQRDERRIKHHEREVKIHNIVAACREYIEQGDDWAVAVDVLEKGLRDIEEALKGEV